MNTFRKALQGLSNELKDSAQERRYSIAKMPPFWSASGIVKDLRTKAFNDERNQVLRLDYLYEHVKKRKCNSIFVAELMHKHGWVIERVDYPWVKAWGDAYEKKHDIQLGWEYVDNLSYPIEVVIYKGPPKEVVEQKQKERAERRAKRYERLL